MGRAKRSKGGKGEGSAEVTPTMRRGRYGEKLKGGKRSKSIGEDEEMGSQGRGRDSKILLFKPYGVCLPPMASPDLTLV